MRKLKLDLDALTVKSFATSAEQDSPAAQGTIHAHSTPTITIPLTTTISFFLCDGAEQQQEDQHEQPVQY